MLLLTCKRWKKCLVTKRKYKPSHIVVDEPFSQRNCRACDYWKEYHVGQNGTQNMQGNGGPTMVIGQKVSIWYFLKGSWSFQNFDLWFYQVFDSRRVKPRPGCGEHSISFQPTGYNTGKPDLGGCKKVFKLVIDHEQPLDYVGGKRVPTTSKKKQTNTYLSTDSIAED
jgi:hypothetical protein